MPEPKTAPDPDVLPLPLLVATLRQALETAGHPSAKAAAEALRAVDHGIFRQDLLAEPLTAATRQALPTPVDPAAGAGDAFTRRWRPAFGYSMAGSWLATMAAVAWTVLDDPQAAPAVISALLDVAPLWAVALGVLGVSVVKRSQDKRIMALEKEAAPAQSPPAGTSAGA